MSLILLTSDLHELGISDIDVDVDIGTTNDFEISAGADEEIRGFYIPGTEYGGLVEYSHIRSDSAGATYRGWTWRGLLTQYIIQPPAEEGYLRVSGDANTIIASILAPAFGGFFTVPETASVEIHNYQIARYVTALDGLSAMLDSVNYRLSIHAEKTAAGEPIEVTVEAVPQTVLAGVFNADSPVPLTYTVDDMGINHLICLGQGELAERTVLHLYADANGNVSQTQTIFGFDERQAVYDYPNAEDVGSLLTDGTKRLKELISGRTLGVETAELTGMELGDKVVGYFPDGTVITAPVIGKVCTIAGGNETITYKIEGGS